MTGSLDGIQRDDIVGTYRILRPLKGGEGGMARVFEAEVRDKYRERGGPRRVALKVAKNEYQGALNAEADYLARCSHRNVVGVYPLPGFDSRKVYATRAEFDFGWGWYYAMEFVSGGSLETHLKQPTTATHLLRPAREDCYPRSMVQVVGITRQVLQGLAHIHAQGIVHLDVKPSNILLRRRRARFLRSSVPEVVLADFGTARDLRYPRMGMLGYATLEYMSPEQALERHRQAVVLDPRSDLFSMGVVLYEMVTGRLPFEALDVLLAADYSPVAPHQLRPSISSELERLIMRALAKDAFYRFQSAEEMLAALDAVPHPVDWAATARRAFAGVTLVTGLTVGAFGIGRIDVPEPVTPTPADRAAPTVPPVTQTPAPQNTPIPPTATAATSTPTPQSATSTPRPTSTPTRTWVPTPTPDAVTATPTLAPPNSPARYGGGLTPTSMPAPRGR